jgi:hypothetical protein
MYYTVSKNKIIYIPAAIFIFFAISPFFVALASNLATNSGGGGGSIPFEIPPDVRSNIEKNKPLYESVAKEYGIPWQALAAVHYREADCDPNKSSMSGEELGSENPDNHQVYTTLEESLKASAAHLKEMAKSVYQVELNENPDDASLGWAFLAYNRGYLYKLGKGCANPSCSRLKDCPGQAGTPYDKSPYVVNFIDENHKNMPWNGCLDSGWTFKDPRAGALTIYKLLGGASSGGDACANIGGPGKTIDKAALDASLREMLSRGAYGGNGNAVEQYLETFEVTVWNGSSEVKKTIKAHKLVVGSLKAIFAELNQMKYPIVSVGCFREEQGATAGSTSSISAHRFGIACDINENYNFGNCGTDPYKVTPEVAAVFARHGWPVWGLCKSRCGMGSFNTFCDGMHFSTQDPAVPGILK